jgi:microcin C transport system permease protein
MYAYIVRRLLLMIPTLFGIMVINFAIFQFVPGGPVEQMIAKLQGNAVGIEERITGGSERGDLAEDSFDVKQGGGTGGSAKYRGAQGLPPEFIAELEAQFGLDKPWYKRFFIMVGSYIRFDFGDSFFKDQPVVDLVIDRLPVSISLGVWTTLLSYLISIPLGVSKAVRDGSRFDLWTSAVIIFGYAIPSFLFAILMIVLFASGTYWDIFPLRGLLSPGWQDLGPIELALDYMWHITLPVIALSIGVFAGTTMLTKNSFIDQINQQYVLTARSKGLTERRVLYGHVFRNGMLIVIAGFPGAFITMFFTGSFLIEVLFSLDGLGQLGLEAAFNRDYPIMFGTLYVFSLLGLVVGLITDLTYAFIDPRIDFERREA